MEISQANLLVQILREASQVRRAHTMPHHGVYTVGQHSFDMATLLLALHPNHSHALLKAVLCHDLAERYTGDMPTPAKQTDPELGKRVNQIELRVMRQLNADFPLSEEDRRWLHSLDKLEALLWAKDQLGMGNGIAQSMINNIATWFNENKDNIPQPVLTFASNHQWLRTSDEIPK